MKFIYNQVDKKWHVLLKVENIKSYSLVINLLFIGKAVNYMEQWQNNPGTSFHYWAVSAVEKKSFFFCMSVGYL